MSTELSSVDPLADCLRLNEKTVAVNEGLVVGALRQHELAEAAEHANALLQAEIAAHEKSSRALAEKARLLNLTNDAIIVRDLEHKVTSWNKGAEKLYGWTSEEAVGNDLHTLLQTQFPKPRAEIEAQLLREERFSGEVVQFARDGHRIVSLCRWALDRETSSILTSYTDLTDWKRAEAALAASEMRFRTAVSMVSSLIWTNTSQGEMRGAQPGWSNFTGQTEEEYQGYGWASAVHPEDAQPTIDAWNAAVAEKRPFEFEHRLRRADGEWRLCSIRAVPLLGADGDIPEWVGVHTDITERKRNEEVLRASEERLSAFVTASSDVVYQMSADWSIMGRLVGRGFIADSAEPSSTWLEDNIFPQDQAYVMATIREAIRTKSVFALEHRVRRADGTEGWTNSKAVPIFNAQGEITEWFGTASDVTDRRQAEETLREKEAFMRSIVESSPDCIKVLNLAGNLLSMESGQELLGIINIAPLLGQPWTTFWKNEGDRVAAREAIAKAAKGGEGHFVGFFRTLHGEDKWWDVAITPIRDAKGEPERLLAVSRDITERRKLEVSLQARAADLAQADRSKDEFLAMLAHELRNPLAPLRNAAEILRSPSASAETTQMAHSILSRQVENMSRMIDDLLDVSRITEGKIELRLEQVDLATVLNAAAELARPNIEASGQELEITSLTGAVFLHADPTRLEQIFGNLLNNASKYSTSGCHISLTAERSPARKGEPAAVLVRVRDDGAGIAPELLPRIFDLFVQATRSLDRSHGGLGIGLTLVQRLVKLHGGGVEAHSEGLGHGTEFIVRLPILEFAPLPPAPPAPLVGTTPRRILVVDDNADSAHSMAALQSRRGHQTRIALTGFEALSVAAEFLPEVVLLDIGLPGMDGYEVARLLRLMPTQTTAFLVAITGYGGAEDRARAKLAGFDEYLVKPADLDLLREWLATRVGAPR